MKKLSFILVAVLFALFTFGAYAEPDGENPINAGLFGRVIAPHFTRAAPDAVSRRPGTDAVYCSVDRCGGRKMKKTISIPNGGSL